jgi:LSD1 subclass zinc finger protein
LRVSRPRNGLHPQYEKLCQHGTLQCELPVRLAEKPRGSMLQSISGAKQQRCAWCHKSNEEASLSVAPLPRSFPTVSPSHAYSKQSPINQT